MLTPVVLSGFLVLLALTWPRLGGGLVKPVGSTGTHRCELQKLEIDVRERFTISVGRASARISLNEFSRSSWQAAVCPVVCVSDGRFSVDFQ